VSPASEQFDVILRAEQFYALLRARGGQSRVSPASEQFDVILRAEQFYALLRAPQGAYALLRAPVFIFARAWVRVTQPTLQSAYNGNPHLLFNSACEKPNMPKHSYLEMSGIYRATWDWSQRVVSTRILRRLQHPVTHQSRLQWIHPHTYFKL
jgi:hypothetical protein